MSDILRWKTVKTRKEHKCFGCAKKYPAETKMAYAVYVDGGDISGCYWCDTCQEYMSRHFRHGDETDEGGIYDNDPDTWEAIKKESEVE